LSDDDEVELHEQDTLKAETACRRRGVRTLVEEGPAAIRQLIDWGAEFDREEASWPSRAKARTAATGAACAGRFDGSRDRAHAVPQGGLAS